MEKPENSTGTRKTTPAPVELLHSFFDGFKRLNPELSDAEREQFLRAAAATDAGHFAEFAERTGVLIDAYLNSPSKLTQKDTLAEYFKQVDNSARLLAEKGEISSGEATSATERHSVALVNPQLFSSLDWCKVLNQAKISKPLVLAVDACKRRNQLLLSIIEYCLIALHRIDEEAAVNWSVQYANEQRGNLDPDIVRDLLNAWLLAEKLSPDALNWAQQWSADENLLRQWPNVVARADKLLRQHALRAWHPGSRGRNSSVAHLQLLVEQSGADDQKLVQWLENAIIDIGESVQFFVSINLDAGSEWDNAAEWRRGALLREIKVIEALFTPLLLLADLMFQLPNGAYRLALAFFGLVGKGKEDWEHRLLILAEKAVRLRFLTLLRKGQSPLEAIQELTFGDHHVYLKLMGELDWLRKDFDSIKQREKVVKQLAIFYASYREAELLQEELSSRYRNLMRVVHEDNLRRVLGESYCEVENIAVLRDLAAMAAEARKFLTRRRALKTSLEDMVAAELDFIRTLRRRRLYFIHKLLQKQQA